MRRPWNPVFIKLAGKRVCQIPLSRGLFALVDVRFLSAVLPYAWCAVPAHNTTYAYAKEETPNGRRKTLRLHQLIGRLLGLDGQVDHKNSNGLDCRWRNLRSGIGWRNLANQRKWRKPTSSKYKGVCWAKRDRTWRAYINVEGKRKNLGSFPDEVAAALAYDAAAKVTYGTYANLNFKEAA